MNEAICNVGSPIYVPAGEYLNGEVLEIAAWARKGVHTFDVHFAIQQEANGYLEISSVDGKPVVWGACCNNH